jgi:aspartokinase-like uncharacterized kinase
VTSPLVVVKLGGSHALSAMLPVWLRAISDHAGRVVVVPGGGPFADAVRAAQPMMGFDDDAAHDMALMAMAQFGRALTSLAPGFVAVDAPPSCASVAETGQIPVWSPWPLLRDHPDIPRSWSVTSDSLAVWLAGEIEAPRVVLIKHRAPPSDQSPAALAEDGLVDIALPHFAARYRGRIVLAGPDDIARAAELFRGHTATAESQ